MSISILNEDLHEVQKHGEVDCHGLKWVYQLLWNQELVLYSKLMHHAFFCITNLVTNLVTNFVTDLHILSCFCCFSVPDESRSAYFSSNSDSGAELTELTHHSPDTMRLWLYTNGGNIWKRPLLPLGHATMWSCPIWDYLLYSSHSWSGFTATRLHFSWKTNYTNKVDEERILPRCQRWSFHDSFIIIHVFFSKESFNAVRWIAKLGLGRRAIIVGRGDGAHQVLRVGRARAWLGKRKHPDIGLTH